MTFYNWVNGLFGKTTRQLARKQSKRPRARRHRAVPQLELLESRLTPATHTWTGLAGGGDLNWGNPANWDVAAPANGEGGAIILNFPSVATALKATVDNIAGLNVDQINITDSGYSFGASGATTMNLTGALSPAISDTAGGNSFNTPLTINLSGTCTSNTAGSFDSFNSLITGPGGITASGTAGFFLSNGGNSYAGQTTVNSGGIQVLADHALGSPAGGTVVNSGGALGLQNVNYATAEPLQLSGVGGSFAGALEFQVGPCTFAGNVTLAADTSIAGNTGLSLTGTVNSIGSSHSLTQLNFGSAPVAFQGAVGNMLALSSITQPNGVGVMTFENNVTLGTGTSTFSDSVALIGPLTFASGGNVSFGIDATKALTISGGVALDIASGQTITGNATTTLSNGLTVQNAGNVTLAGAVSGSGSITMNGTGTLVLTGSNSYLGTTTISSGTLQVGNGGTTGTLGSGNVTDNATLAYNLSNLLTLTSVISGTGLVDINTGGVTQSGGSISVPNLRLRGTGTFALTQSNAVGTVAANTTGTITFNDGSTALTVGTVPVAGTVGITSGGNDVTLCTTSASGITISQAINAGATGNVRLQSSDGVSQTAAITANQLGVNASGTIALDGATNTVNAFAALDNTSGAAVRFANSGAFTQAQTVSAASCFPTAVTGITGTGAADISLCQTSGTLNIDNPLTTTGTIRLANTNGGISQSAVITAPNLGVSASGTVTLTNASNNVASVFAASVTGGNAVSFRDSVGFSTGTVTGVAGTCFPTGVTGVTTTANGAINLQAAGTLTVAAGAGVTAGGSGTVALTTTGATSDLLVNATVSSTTGGITAQAGRSITFGTNNGMTTGGNVSLTSNTASGIITQTNTGSSVTANNLGITANGKSGAGDSVGSSAQSFVFTATTLTVNSSPTNGNQWLADTATVGLSAANALNAGTGTIHLTGGTFQAQVSPNAIVNTSPLIVTSPAVFDLNGNNETVFSLAGNGSVKLGTGVLTTGNNTADNPNFSGVISGSGGVTKLGSDTWTLSGLNTYTGPTNLNGGTLTVTGAINNTAAAAGGAMNLNTAGVTLNGSGTIFGQVTVTASTFANRSQIQNVTITVPTGGTGITVNAGVTFAQIGTTSGVTINGGNATSTGILVQGSALIENSNILGQNVDVNINGGTSALQGNTLTPGTGNLVTGLLVQGGAIVDAGQLSASATRLPNGPAGNVGYYGDITGLFSPSGVPLSTSNHSTGGNAFGTAGSPFSLDTSALATPNPGPNIPQAIRNENTGTAPFGPLANGVEQSFNYGAFGPQLGRMDTTAQGDTWNGNANLPLFQIEQLVFHDLDDPNTVGFVTYGNTTAPAPTITVTPLYTASTAAGLTATQAGQGTLVNGSSQGTEQMSAIRALQVTFSSYVFLDPNLLSATSNRGIGLFQLNSPYGPAGSGGAAVPQLVTVQVFSASYNRTTGAYTVVFTFTGPTTEFGSLQDGNYSLSFIAAAIQGGGPGGPALTGTFASPSTYTALFHRLFGDANGDGKVDDTDLAIMQAALRTRIGMAQYRAMFDFDGNGVVDSSDYYQFLRRYKTKLNPDGTVSTIP